MYILYDEYYANRKSFEIVDEIAKPKTLIYRRFINFTFFGHVNSLLKDNYYLRIKEQIAGFRSHGDVRYFLNQVNPCFDEVSKDIVYAYSFIDHFFRLKKVEPLLHKSTMVNENTMALIDFYRQKYVLDDLDLNDGLAIMQDYMTNFGIIFRDIPEGIYVDVLNI